MNTQIRKLLATSLPVTGTVLALVATGLVSCGKGAIDGSASTGDGDGGGGGTTTGPDYSCDSLARTIQVDCSDSALQEALTLLRAMTLEQKITQMSGPAFNPTNMFDQPDVAELDIPGHLYLDGPRGARWYNSDHGTTVFPVAASRAATWNLELERLIGKAMARETRVLGRHILLAPTVNHVIHPRWGRAQETYGESTHLLGAMGKAFIRGAQYDPTQADAADPNQEVEDTYRIQACAKHFAANNIEDTRIYVNAVLDERTMREVFLPQFQDTVEEEVACFMASYNRVNGDYAGFSSTLLREILKEEWGYSGYVISDWFAKGQTNTSPAAGLDVEMPFSSGPFPSQFDSAYFYGSTLVTAVNSGQVDEVYVNEAALRILYQKAKFGVIDYDVTFEPWKTKTTEAQALALDAARQGMTLLKNGATAALSDDYLPVDPTTLTKIAVVGRYANEQNTGDKGSSDAKAIDASVVYTPYEGIQQAAGSGVEVVTFESVSGNEASIQDADLVVVVTAYVPADLQRSTDGEEGEWTDRDSLELAPRDLANVQAAAALGGSSGGPKVVVAAKSGSSILVESWIDSVDAFVMIWFGGMGEGIALADVLFGNYNPSGKTAVSWVRQESDLPVFQNNETNDVPYDYYHGYRYLEKNGIAPRYPFGYGLSYTTFGYANLQLASDTVAADGTVEVSVDVTNTGPVAGTEIVQAYVGFDNTSVSDQWGRPVKQLFAFARVEDLAPGATETVTLQIPVEDLAYWDVANSQFVVETMEHQLYVGPSSDSNDANMLKGSFTVQ